MEDIHHPLSPPHTYATNEHTVDTMFKQNQWKETLKKMPIQILAMPYAGMYLGNVFQRRLNDKCDFTVNRPYKTQAVRITVRKERTHYTLAQLPQVVSASGRVSLNK